MKSYISLKMKEDRWSPELISAKGLEKFGEFVSSETNIVEKRKRFGDVEVDLVIGKNHKPGLLVITDRSTLKTKLRKIDNKNSTYIAKALIKELKQWAPNLKTIKYISHQDVKKKLRKN